jgi:hypothetical protein
MLKSLPPYNDEKYKELILDSAETDLGFFGFYRVLIAILREIMGEGSRGSMKS